MTSSPSTTPATFTATHQFAELFGVEIPLPALQRGWLHGREFVHSWDVERIAAKIGEACWFSHYSRDHTEDDIAKAKFAPHAIAGFWPEGGFLELQMHRGNPLEEQHRGNLGIYTDSPARAEALMAGLLAHYIRDLKPVVTQPRVGMLNFAYGNLTVERIPVTLDQTVGRDRVDLYYRDGMTAWTDAWVETLNTRRYGLTILTGAPGTGKTTLLRSLAHWLVDTHVFYFMPAARFATIESGEIVSFWAGENRTSKLRKVLILEDAESIVLRRNDDNREKVATLLNLTDGMLGDALGLHVVCTLNSDLTDIDPALLRPGRLVAHRDFDLLNATEACRLARALGLPEPDDGEPIALAELFARRDTATVAAPATRRKTVGFHTLIEIPNLTQ